MVIVEVVSGGKSTARTRTPARRLTVGRGLGNDIVVDDPYVDASHLVLRYDAHTGDWTVEDLASTNGTSIAGRAVGAQPTAIGPGAEITLGKSRLRLLDIDHPVATTRSLADLEHRLLGLGTTPTVVGLVAAVAVATLLPSYLTNWQELKASAFFNEFAMMGVILLVNTALWSLLSRVLRGETRFGALLALTCVETLVLGVAALLGDISEYNFPGFGAQAAVRFTIEIGIGTLFLYATLRLATNLRNFSRSGICVLAFAAIISVYFVNQSAGNGRFQTNPTYEGRLMPPPLLIVRGEDARSFGARLPSLFDDAVEQAHEDDDVADETTEGSDAD